MRSKISFDRKTCVHCGSNKLVKKVDYLPVQLKEEFNWLQTKVEHGKIQFVYCNKCKNIIIRKCKKLHEYKWYLDFAILLNQALLNRMHFY